MQHRPVGFQTALEDFLGEDTGQQVLDYAKTHRAAEHLAGYPAILTVEEVATILGTTGAAVLAITGTDQLPALEIGHTIRRYWREDVHHYLQHHIHDQSTDLQ